MLYMDKKQSLTGIDTQAKPSICCCTSTFEVGSYLRLGANYVVVLSVSVRLSSITYHISPVLLKFFLKLVLYVYRMDTVRKHMLYGQSRSYIAVKVQMSIFYVCAII